LKKTYWTIFTYLREMLGIVDVRNQLKFIAIVAAGNLT